ncbi:MATE family efflux transporter [Clostridium sporogenes]|uniref:MATE family efflux transporter n=2 Tax=Clostridium TaxID=1485 RepID=A0A6B4FDQ3_CLOSG|nr:MULTISPECIES: MATE family efflux transporter [Clostridium]AJD31658.1 MATE efflux family protein [Clostridium botulinum Prevot_594]AVP60081.1 MATE family efflux transporter [Clostridium botulinum]AVP65062.1 MATE family efflux transporter [Clostridium botulinum]EHN14300.1 Na+ driven multidrug efflux pump [Clostridium sporogenes PA 3679]KOY64319.1 MATE family efflux transporter [Clostridium sporogenes]
MVNSKNLCKDLFNDKMFYSKLFKIALPVVIQNFIASSLNMVDTMMIGKVGEAEIAAVGIANQYFLLFSLFIIGFASGCSIFISQFWGKKDKKNIKKILGMGLIISTIIAILFTAMALIMPDKIILFYNKDSNVVSLGSDYLVIVSISYIFTAITFNYGIGLRCIEKATVPMLISMVALLVNTILNYTLIFGHFGFEAMGVKGAAIATLIARIIESVVTIIYVYHRKTVLAATPKEMISVDKEFFTKSIKTIIPVVLNEVCWGLGMTVYSAVYGRIGTKAIASVQICTTVQNLFMVISFGLANASTVMIGHEIGASKEENGKLYAKRFAILGVIAGLILGIIIALSANAILSIFSVSEEVIQDSLKILYITALVMVVRVFNITLIVGILRGGGDAKTPLLIEAFTMWCIGVPLALLGAFVLKLPVYWVVALSTAEELSKFVIGLKRLKSNKWIRNVTV